MGPLWLVVVAVAVAMVAGGCATGGLFSIESGAPRGFSHPCVDAFDGTYVYRECW